MNSNLKLVKLASLVLLCFCAAGAPFDTPDYDPTASGSGWAGPSCELKPQNIADVQSMLQGWLQSPTITPPDRMIINVWYKLIDAELKYRRHLKRDTDKFMNANPNASPDSVQQFIQARRRPLFPESADNTNLNPDEAAVAILLRCLVEKKELLDSWFSRWEVSSTLVSQMYSNNFYESIGYVDLMTRYRYRFEGVGPEYLNDKCGARWMNKLRRHEKQLGDTPKAEHSLEFKLGPLPIASQDCISRWLRYSTGEESRLIWSVLDRINENTGIDLSEVFNIPRQEAPKVPTKATIISAEAAKKLPMISENIETVLLETLPEEDSFVSEVEVPQTSEEVMTDSSGNISEPVVPSADENQSQPDTPSPAEAPLAIEVTDTNPPQVASTPGAYASGSAWTPSLPPRAPLPVAVPGNPPTTRPAPKRNS